MVWLTSEKPCSGATRPPTPRPRGRPPRRWSRNCGTPGGGDGAREHRRYTDSPVSVRSVSTMPARPSPAASGRRWSGRCSRRGDAVRRAVPGPSGTRRGSPAASRSPRAAGWSGRWPVMARPRPRARRRRPRCARGDDRRAGRALRDRTVRRRRTPAALRIFRCWLTSGCGTPSASTSSCTQRWDSRNCSTMAIRTGAASARSSSPAASRISRGGGDGVGGQVGMPAGGERVEVMADRAQVRVAVVGGRRRGRR